MDKESNDKDSRRKGIPTGVTQRLIAITAGRCEFRGCNKRLFEDELTTKSGNYSEKAHILPSAKKGPRGEFIQDEDANERNKEENIMLLCAEHHHEIDSRPSDYPPELLREMKREHEERIRVVTQIVPEHKTHVVIYESLIGSTIPSISDHEATAAVLPDRYPVAARATRLSSNLELDDTMESIWEFRRKDLIQKFNALQSNELNKATDTQHVSLFAFASIPMLVQLGVLFNKINTSVYHPRFRNKRWQWEEFAPLGFKFETRFPNLPTGEKTSAPVLILSISGPISDVRVHAVMGKNCHIWELTVPREFCNPFSIRGKSQVEDFKRYFRTLHDEIKAVSAQGAELHIFPAIPVPIAVELGRCRLEKCDMPWTIYDQNPETNAFIKTITIK